MIPPKFKNKKANIKDLLPNYHPLALELTGKKLFPTNKYLIRHIAASSNFLWPSLMKNWI
jgi:hypothetical protein